jgi:formylglycine-generating enzyme required for sulfatase activity
MTTATFSLLLPFIHLSGGSFVMGPSFFCNDPVWGPRWTQVSPYFLGETHVAEGPYRNVMGDVREWVADHHPENVAYRMLRGGSRYHMIGTADLRIAQRGFNLPGVRSRLFSFRLAATGGAIR